MKKRLLIYLSLLVIVIVLILTLKWYAYDSKYNNGIDLALPPEETSKAKTKRSLEVSVGGQGEYSIGENRVEKGSLEIKMINFIKSEGYNGIIIRSHQDVEMRHVVYIMDIANRNKIKSTVGSQD
jgi:biopolymer transport protein ExbD